MLASCPRAIIRMSVIALIGGHALAADNEARKSASAFGHSVDITHPADGGHTVVVNGTPLFSDRSDAELSVLGIYTANSHPYAVIKQRYAGNACPVKYRVISLVPTPKQTRTFGTCRDHAHISTLGETLKVTLPASSGQKTYSIHNTQITP
ncbi:hypothetical protein AA101099_3034 [Neoasaia chiangmaiensis NBRC 101099]|uniref:Uncharacterized protein n=2 Tax=Neoasaia chiangmaiensis TaxID=320497 RepID=A0A1U9KNQ5_9PROT|nr:hypothetical protein [Neoasaia chiangmaiensis]AQS87379.1 hypothetical protein A0U93_04870 [Neoasaia chiangmaiensis]GBR42925.1 hypothetical protein AA101099_3034 [Neoasaia chiangmaiensis NBRC 101099]GEN16144.1 hypothetical protein NCH01_25750 [Neoasaia chiangmaiensis]